MVVTNNGATVDNSGKIGKCYNFNGSSYLTVSLPNLSSYSTTACSMAVWIKVPNPSSGNKQILNIGTSSGWANIRFGLLYRTNSSEVVTNISNGTNYVAYSCNASIVPETWVHVATVYQNKHLKLYINGQLKKTFITTYDISFNGITKLGIGAAPNGNEKYTGHLNDVRIYDHALSSMEVKQISQGLILHYPLNNNGFGQKNLLKDSKNQRNSKNTYIYWPFKSEDIEEISGKICTISFDAKSTTNNVACDVYFRSDSAMVGSSIVVSNIMTNYNRFNITMVAPTDAFVSICFRNNGKVSGANTSATYSYKNIKVELGQKATPWCPYEEDKLYTILKLNDNIEYDCSGFNNNGEKININYDSDTPKYDVSSVFSASPSIIKILNSNYAIQGSQNMTISVWAYKEDWSQYAQRIYSCTEGGGLNIQLSSNNMQWSVNVYTDAEKTSHKYASSSPDLYIRVPRADFSSGWHMFTWVYTTSGTSLYVDGVLKQSKTGISYGLYFHSTAPLILGGQATSTNYSSPYLDGKLSDFRIYITALSAEDILALYKNSVYIDNEGNLYGAELREV